MSIRPRPSVGSALRCEARPVRRASMTITFGILSHLPAHPVRPGHVHAALVTHLRRGRRRGRRWSALVDAPAAAGAARSSHQLGDRARRDEARAAAAALNACDVAVVQHEYGIYGGPDGDGRPRRPRRASACPVITVLHTVLTDPTAAPARGARAAGRRVVASR